MAQRMQHGLTSSSNQHSKGGLTRITLNDKAVALLNPFLIDENRIDECRLDECTKTSAG